MHPNPHRPEGADVFMSGLWHKIGARGLPFVYINGEWIRSNKPASEIIRQTKRRPDGTFTE